VGAANQFDFALQHSLDTYAAGLALLKPAATTAKA
jgi:hypothetical protein